jgi:outer membrane protein TolC
MKHYRHICIGFYLSACLFTAQPSAEAQAPLLTLPESIALAMKNNPAIQIAEANVEKAAWNLKEAKGYNGVKLGYNLQYGKTDQPPSWYNNTNTPYPLPIQYPAWTDSYTFYTHQLKLELPLYTGKKLESTADLAKRGKAIVHLGLTSTQQQLALWVTDTYYTVLEACNLSGVARQAVDDLTLHLTNVKYHYEAGNVPFSDVLQTEVRLANARNTLIKAENAVTMSRYKLNKVIGLELTDATELDDTATYEPYTVTLKDSLAIAFNHRPEIQQASLKVAMAKDNVKIVQSDLLPTVGAAAIENIRDSVPANSKHNNNWTVGLNVSFNVFDNGITKAKTKEALTEITIALQQERQVKDAITLEVSNAYLGVQEASERSKNNQVAVNQAKRDYEMAQERYNAGLGTNLDVMDAEVAMTQAKTNYIEALYDYNKSIAELRKAMGVLN